MAALALRVLPGVLVSLLLAGPVFAASVRDTAGVAAREHAPDQRRAAVRGHKQAHLRAAQATRRRAGPELTAFIDDAEADRPAWTQTGVASWYGGSRWQGQRTSDGSRYDQDGFTAAHATLPLGTRVRVTLSRSGAAVVVTITDRPGTHARIIDLSRGAARVLGILDKGVAMVTLSPD